MTTTKPYLTFLEFPGEALTRERFRQLIRLIHKEPWYAGNEGRKIHFQFDTLDGANQFMASFQEMMAKRGVETQKENINGLQQG